MGSLYHNNQCNAIPYLHIRTHTNQIKAIEQNIYFVQSRAAAKRNTMTPKYKYSTKKKKNNRFRPFLCNLTAIVRCRGGGCACKISKICYHCIPDRHAKSPPTRTIVRPACGVRRPCYLGACACGAVSFSCSIYPGSALGSRAGAQCAKSIGAPVAASAFVWRVAVPCGPRRGSGHRRGRVRRALGGARLSRRPCCRPSRACGAARWVLAPAPRPACSPGSVGRFIRLACLSRLASIVRRWRVNHQSMMHIQIVQRPPAELGRRAFRVTIAQRPANGSFHAIPRPSVIASNVTVQQTHPVPVKRRRIRAQPLNQIGQIYVSGQMRRYPATTQIPPGRYIILLHHRRILPTRHQRRNGLAPVTIHYPLRSAPPPAES